VAHGVGTSAPRRPESPALSDVVRAAGGVVIRAAGAGFEVLVVHRPRYRDWSFPKGKAEPGESDEECALREVEEETGLVCELDEELSSTSYTDGAGRSKRVRYWRMHVVGGSLVFEHEVDDARWLAPERASELLSYERDRSLLGELSL
jgi:8-oxo-dGTP pyrophosphatase MutT (NUDIX family)